MGARTSRSRSRLTTSSQLTGDLVGLLDHYGYEKALFVGHDWGAIVVWAMAVMHPNRVAGVINLSVPFLDRGTSEWVGIWEKLLGPDFYIVHFNRKPGVADAAFAKDPKNLLRNLYRTGQWNDPPPTAEPRPGMAMVNLVEEQNPRGRLMMSEAELDVFAKAFTAGGFTGPINWYRNFTRNWKTLGDFPQKVACNALMIHGKYDMVQASDRLTQFVPNVEVETLAVRTLDSAGRARGNEPADARLAGAKLQSLRKDEERRRVYAAPRRLTPAS